VPLSGGFLYGKSCHTLQFVAPVVPLFLALGTNISQNANLFAILRIVEEAGGLLQIISQVLCYSGVTCNRGNYGFLWFQILFL